MHIFAERNCASKRNVRILICTGIFPPDIGGPAKYAEQLHKEFQRRGHQVRVLSFGAVKRWPSGLRHMIYFCRTLFYMCRADFTLALDTFSAGFPAVVAAKLLGRKIAVRIGGDFLWESYIERTDARVYLREFYARIPVLSAKEQFLFAAMKALARGAGALIFNTAWQKDIFVRAYGAAPEKAFTVENFYPEKAAPAGERIPISPSAKKIFLWAGRPVKFKNIAALARAFQNAEEKNGDIKLEMAADISVRALEEKLKTSRALIIPSLTEIGSNTVIEALACNVPFILSRESGLYERLKDVGIFVDPLDEEAITRAILLLADDAHYAEYKKRATDFHFTHSWAEIADEILTINGKI